MSVQLCDVLRVLRAASGLTQREVSELLVSRGDATVTTTIISNVERGVTDMPFARAVLMIEELGGELRVHDRKDGRELDLQIEELARSLAEEQDW